MKSKIVIELTLAEEVALREAIDYLITKKRNIPIRTKEDRERRQRFCRYIKALKGILMDKHSD